MKRIFGIALLVILVASAAAAQDGQAQFDQAMQPILNEYLGITAALAADKTDGVSAAAAKIADLGAKLDPTNVEPAHAKHYAGIAANIPVAAKKLADAKDIASMRAALAELSKPMALWAEHQATAPATLVYCPMVKAPWLQTGTAVRNPYYGSKMLTCGEIKAKEGQAESEEPAKHHHH